jgi:hypothetical protein
VIVVTRILGDHLAECRIEQDNAADPIVPGDWVYAADGEGKRAQPEPGAAEGAEAYREALTALREEVSRLRMELREAQAERDEYLQRVVELTDRLQKVTSERPKESPAERKAPPAGLRGAILSVAEKGLVEVSLGSDDGLRAGHRLVVYRFLGYQATYVGRIDVLEAAPDKSVCRALPEFPLRTMRTGDRVATEIPEGTTGQVVKIEADGQIRVYGTPMTLEVLLDTLSVRAKEFPKESANMAIPIAVHPDAKHERVAEVIEACGKTGFHSVTLWAYDDGPEGGPPAASRL